MKLHGSCTREDGLDRTRPSPGSAAVGFGGGVWAGQGAVPSPGKPEMVTSTRAPRCQPSCVSRSHAGSHSDERPSSSPDSPEQRAAARPRSRTDLNGSGRPHAYLRIRRLGVRVPPSAPGHRPLPIMEWPLPLPQLLRRPLTSRSEQLVDGASAAACRSTGRRTAAYHPAARRVLTVRQTCPGTPRTPVPGRPDPAVSLIRYRSCGPPWHRVTMSGARARLPAVSHDVLLRARRPGA